MSWNLNLTACLPHSFLFFFFLYFFEGAIKADFQKSFPLLPSTSSVTVLCMKAWVCLCCSVSSEPLDLSAWLVASFSSVLQYFLRVNKYGSYWAQLCSNFNWWNIKWPITSLVNCYLTNNVSIADPTHTTIFKTYHCHSFTTLDFWIIVLFRDPSFIWMFWKCFWELPFSYRLKNVVTHVNFWTRVGAYSFMLGLK